MVKNTLGVRRINRSVMASALGAEVAVQAVNRSLMLSFATAELRQDTDAQAFLRSVLLIFIH